MDLEQLLKKIKDELKKVRGIRNVEFVERDFENYKKVPCLEFNLSSQKYNTDTYRIYGLVFKRLIEKVPNLTIIYENPYALNLPKNFKRIRIYIKSKEENEKHEILQDIAQDFYNSISLLNQWGFLSKMARKAKGK